MKKTLAPTALAFGVSAIALTGLAPSASAAPLRSCADVRAAGIHTPIPYGSPHYAPHLDRDDDGWACEPDGVTLPDPRKAHKPAPSKTSPTPSRPTSPAASAPASPMPDKGSPASPGPKVDTDYVKPAATNDMTVLVASGALVGLVGVGAWRLRASKR